MTDTNQKFPASNITLKMTGPALNALLAAEPTLTAQLSQQILEEFVKRQLKCIENSNLFAQVNRQLEAKNDALIEAQVGKVKRYWNGSIESVEIKSAIWDVYAVEIAKRCEDKLRKLVSESVTALLDSKLNQMINDAVEYRIGLEVRTRVKEKMDAALKGLA